MVIKEKETDGRLLKGNDALKTSFIDVQYIQNSETEEVDPASLEFTYSLLWIDEYTTTL